MRFIQMFVMRLRALVLRDAVDRDLADEMREHLEHLAQEHIARGMTPEAARDAARREFGPVTQLVEESRDARGVMWMVNGWQDVRYGARLMARAPGFAAAVILTVALGIGATTAMFSVVYGLVLKPLPYGDPDRLVNLWTTAPARGVPRGNVTMANVYDWKARNHVFTDVAALRPIANFNLTGLLHERRAHPGPHGAGGTHPGRAVVDRLLGGGGDPRCRSRAAGVRRAHAGRGGRSIAGTAMAADGAARRLCLDRAAAGDHRRLRRDRLRRRTADARIRHPPGARRSALGARRGEIVGLVMRRGLALFAAGSAAGLIAAAASARLMASLLFNVSGVDSSSFAAATAILFLVALTACAVPARRAAGVDPSVVLRSE